MEEARKNEAARGALHGDAGPRKLNPAAIRVEAVEAPFPTCCVEGFGKGVELREGKGM